jgi:hypothetical protein
VNICKKIGGHKRVVKVVKGKVVEAWCTRCMAILPKNLQEALKKAAAGRADAR